MSQPRLCDECGFQTTLLVCPRCGGQTDVDPYRNADHYSLLEDDGHDSDGVKEEDDD